MGNSVFKNGMKNDISNRNMQYKKTELSKRNNTSVHGRYFIMRLSVALSISCMHFRSCSELGTHFCAVFDRNKRYECIVRGKPDYKWPHTAHRTDRSPDIIILRINANSGDTAVREFYYSASVLCVWRLAVISCGFIALPSLTTVIPPLQ